MPRWDRDGGRIIVTLFEAAAFQYTIRATCRCGHVAVLQPHALWWRFQRKGWDDRLAAVGERMRCARCRRAGPRIEASQDDVTVNQLPLPPEHEWKRAINRLRS